MSIQFNPHIQAVGNLYKSEGIRPADASRPQDTGSDFAQAVRKSLDNVNDQQVTANQSIVDLLSGNQQDVNTVVAEMAKSDMSFKLLVGVRNKLVEAYKETMRMQV